MVYAIIETGGKQFRVEPGRFYDIERLAVEPDGKVSIDQVFYVHSDSDIHVGQPFVEGATVEGTVLSHMRGRKIIVYKMQPKKKTRKKQGHRQELTRLLIDSINISGRSLGSAVAETPTRSVDFEEAEAAQAAE
jgi:large subunit ribosomal protein L21